MDFQTLLDSNQFLNYPKLSTDIFNALNVPDGVVVLDANYTTSNGLFAKIRLLFNSIIHKLRLNLSASYSTRFEQVKAGILNRDITHYNYFEKSNAFLNVPKISKLIFKVMNKPDKNIVPSENLAPNTNTLYNRITFALSSLRHNINLKISNNYVTKFTNASNKISNAIKLNKIIAISKTNRKQKKIDSKQIKLATKQKEAESKTNDFICALNKRCEHSHDANNNITKLKLEISELEKQLEVFNEGFTLTHQEVTNKKQTLEKIEGKSSENEILIEKLEKTVNEIKTVIDNLEKTIISQKNSLKAFQEELVSVIYKCEVEAAKLFNRPLNRDLPKELEIISENLKNNEGVLKSYQTQHIDETEKLRACKNNKKSFAKEIKTFEKEIEKLNELILSEANHIQEKIIELTEELENEKCKLQSSKKAISGYIKINQTIFDTVRKISDNGLDPILKTLFDEEKNEQISIIPTAQKIEEIKEQLLPKKPIESVINIEKSEFIVEPEIENIKVEKPKTKHSEIIDFFNTYNKPVSALLTSFLSRFPEEDVLDIIKKDNEFVIHLKKPMQLWVPQKDINDPVGGSILLFGIENEVQGKLSNNGFVFTKGFEIYSKHQTWGLVTPNIYSILEEKPGLFAIEAGMNVPFLGKQAETRPIQLAELTKIWGSAEISEVVQGSYIDFLNRKLQGK